MGLRLVFEDKNQAEDGHRVYRSASPMDPQALPAPIATLGANVTSYDDGDVVPGNTYYYRVSAFLNTGEERVSDEVVIQATQNNDLSYLFSLGEKGAHYKISDLSSLFQDEAGTVAAGVGDPVRHVKDLSGNLEHLTLSDLANAPTLETDGERYWLESSGSECHLNVTWPDYPQPNCTVIGFRQNRNPGSNEGPRIIGRSQAARPFQMMYQTTDGEGGVNTRLWANSTSGSVGATVGTDHQVIILFNGIDTTYDLDEAGETPYGADIGPDGCSGLTLFNDHVPDPDVFSTGRFYGALLIDRVLTLQERAEVNDFFKLIVKGI